ncbi:MAG TPA: VRR-NUC domain-containing protein [Amaricoccus sp.]|uniref:VRR-NUC domain-containing protein n=1 Tax=Amaricoccus sp. TaxID=1872485 RepID=UPI002C8AAB51|nr:VRR-NUC domain-containing protein [Amaricoccus sp.]HMQ94628.1 VRR-NUC domain-containing protein [Amaricoccus sp.]HMR54749.1 VRR-NUC domain-containing protein [Amaricoccus sp.]HMR61688.1 VRR-NUC domain-containing protein [Amaricoccus sp.]HMU01761.1 VRR-NUC domain-containing protein [Amaricoccus sp.]
MSGPARRRRNPEADIQRAIVELLRVVLPRGAIVHHSRNEERSGGDEARRRQAIAVGMGIHPGFSDVIVLAGGRVLFLEVKAPRGSLSAAQEAFRDDVLAQGHGWALVRSPDDTLAALAANGFRTRLASVP